MTVVSNTGPLIALAKANRLDLLKQLFGQVEIPPAVHRELFASQTPEAARLDEALSRFVRIAPLSVIPPEVQTITAQLGAGEQQAIALAFERKMLLLMDDRAGRTVARHFGLSVTGLIGILVQAKARGLIPTVLPLLREIRERGYWLVDELLGEAARLAGEKIESG